MAKLMTYRALAASHLALAAALSHAPTLGVAQDRNCALEDGALPQDCVRDNSDIVVVQPVGENASIVVAPPVGAANGFSVRVNGQPIKSDTKVENVARRVDETLAEAQVQVVFDGLGVSPRLDLEVVGEPRAFGRGETVTLQSALNYPAFVTRGELRVVNLSAAGGAQTVSIVPIEPGGQARLVVPAGDDIVVVHRVYDANGRYDETFAVPLSRPDDRQRVDGVEEGANTAAVRRIPIRGGAVTVSGSALAQGAQVRTLGETLRPDPSGGFVIQRILPTGDYDVNVAIAGPGQAPFDQTRSVEIPKSEWFYAGIADLTVGRRELGDDKETFNRGRFAIYVDGRTETGLEITGSLDTGEGPLNEIFRELDEKDPRSTIQRVDPRDVYPTFGDDSTLVDNTPTDGKIYLRLEKQGNFVQWGNFTSQLGGNAYVRNERTLYGLSGQYATPETRANGEAVARFDIYAAQPDRLPARDAFIGTGGSIYFLEQQDIGIGTETITVEVRDPVSNRVVAQRQLVAGVDYDINYIQGVVTLAQPLQSGFVDQGLIVDPGTTDELRLVVQYEFTPTAGDLDGFSYGGRAEVWATDRLRFGLSGQVERTGAADQTLIGVDLRYEVNDNTWLQFDYAESDGPGFGSTLSADGGLIFDSIAATGGTGKAFKLEGRAALSDLGLDAEGQVSAHYERREEGFSSLDQSVTAATGDEELWGLNLDARLSDRLAYSIAIESYDNDAGEVERTAALELSYVIDDRWSLDAGLAHLDRANTTETGTRTDAAVRLTYSLAENAEVYGYLQGTLDASGLEDNNRIGFGASYTWRNGWSLEGDVSDGSQGLGARILASHDNGNGDTSYFGYELEPDREVTGQTLEGRDQGRFIAGAQRVINDRVQMFTENSYDLFGRRRTLTNAYGLSYTPNDATSFSIAYEQGRVTGGVDNDFDRHAISLSAGYQTERTTLSGRVEYRTEEGTLSGSPVATDAFLLTANGTYKFSDAARFVGSLEYARTDTDQGSFLDGEYGDLSLGYAFRPVVNDRLNVLARYRYVHDMFGQRLDDIDDNGPRQRSHVFSIDAIYDLNENWSIGGKIGYRSTESAADETADFVDNDAYLLVAGLTYHLPHEWDALVEVRQFRALDADFTETGVLAAAYRHVGNHLKVGVGYNFGSFSDDLSDLVRDDRGIFLNVIAKF